MYTHSFKKSVATIFLLYVSSHCFGQTNYTYQTFDDTRIVNGHSTETNMEGVMTFIIAHRFGPTSNDSYNLWGMDLATQRMGLQYGITNNLMIGAGRNSFDKTLDACVKYKMLAQSSGDKNMPVTMTILGYGAMKPQSSSATIEYSLGQKTSYAAQVLISRKLNDKFSVQLAPTILHRNLVGNDEYNDIISLGTAMQWQLLKNWSLTAEYYHTPDSMLPDETSTLNYTQTFSLGVQIDTKGHIFSFNLGNTNGMTERLFIAETAGSWKNGNLYIGFNITRDFKVKGRKIR